MAKQQRPPKDGKISEPPTASNVVSTNEVISQLEQGEKNTRCSQLRAMLESLGFEVTRTGKGNHHVIKHKGIPGFWGGNYDCGHGKDPVVKAVYVRKIVCILKDYKEHLSSATVKVKP